MNPVAALSSYTTPTNADPFSEHSPLPQVHAPDPGLNLEPRRSSAGKVSETLLTFDKTKLKSAAPLDRDPVLPLTSDEIQLIKTVCGISNKDASFVPTGRLPTVATTGI